MPMDFMSWANFCAMPAFALESLQRIIVKVRSPAPLMLSKLPFPSESFRPKFSRIILHFSRSKLSESARAVG